jgi:hypothetical protein
MMKIKEKTMTCRSTGKRNKGTFQASASIVGLRGEKA